MAGLLQDLFGIAAPQSNAGALDETSDELLRRALRLNDGVVTASAPMLAQDALPAPASVGRPAPQAQPWIPDGELDARAFGTAMQSAPQPAPQMAAGGPVAPMAPQAAAPQMAGPTMGDRFGRFLMAGSAGSLARGIGEATYGTDRAAATQNATASLLSRQLGIAPDEAIALAKQPEIMRQLLPVMQGRKDTTMLVNNRLIDKRTGRVIADFSDSARQGPEIKTIENADGEKVSVTWNAQAQQWVPVGTGAPAATAPPPQGNYVQPMSGSTEPATGLPQTAGALPPGIKRGPMRDAMSKEYGAAQGKAIAALPGAIGAANRMLESIEAVENDDALSKVTGPVDARTWTILPGSVRAESKIAELQSQAFLQAFESLKGAGAITEQEGKAATEAMGRLKATNVGDADYRVALSEFKATVKGLLDTAKVKAGQLPQDHADARREARLAIRQGKSKKAVEDRLTENGINPAGL